MNRIESSRVEAARVGRRGFRLAAPRVAPWLVGLLCVAGCSVKTDDAGSDAGAPLGNDAGPVTTAPDSGTDAGVDAVAPVDGASEASTDAAVDAGHPPLLDSDGDGFLDADDPAPNDPTIPGNFSTPESILNDPGVKAALAGAKAAGVDIPTHTELTPADVSGYYLTADASGKVVATGDGTDVGQSLAGGEGRTVVYPDLTAASAGIAFTGGAAVGFYSNRGNLLRGVRNEVTFYSRSHGACTIGGADYEIWSVGIGTEEVELTTGNVTDQRGVSVTVATRGTLTAACATSLAGNAEQVGGWTASVTPLSTLVTPAQLKYMCVDEKSGYAPTESWTRSTGASCTCTAQYAVSCPDQ